MEENYVVAGTMQRGMERVEWELEMRWEKSGFEDKGWKSRHFK